MKPELLYRIADLINENSQKYRAVVPRYLKSYMMQNGDHLERICCRVLLVMTIQKNKRGRARSRWNIYETDIDKIITKISRRDRKFALRIEACNPSLFDVEIAVRRASYQSLRLNIATTSLEFYMSDPV